MKEIEDNSIPVIITSPMYNLGGDFHTLVNGKRVSYGGYESDNDNLPENEYQEEQIKLINRFTELIKPDGNIFYNHKNRLKNFICISPLEWILKPNALLRQEIIWDTTNEINQDNRRFIPVHEKIFWLSKTVTHIKNELRLQDCWVFRNKVKRKISKHPATFPLDMVKAILRTIPEADLILDPFSGSSTTAIACLELNRNFICIEKDPKYYALSVKRVNDYKSQMKMEFKK